MRCTAALAVILTLPAAAQDAASQIRSQIRRIQQSVKDNPLSSPDFASANSTTQELLKAAADAADAGRIYLSLEKLGQATDFLQGARTSIEKAGAVKDSLPAFESEWGKASESLNALDRELRAKPSANSRAAIRALSETARVKTIPLLDGARGFATSTQPKDGLFYLGQAQGEAEFARFCASLNLPRKTRSVPVRSLLPELQALQDKTNAAFQPPRSIELHSRFIALNSTLKLARELDAAKFYSGSLYQYLEAIRHYGMLEATASDPVGQSELKQSLAAERKKLEESKEDASIAWIFLERAESQVVHANGSAPSQDEWKSAQVIVRQVLPAFLAARKPASPSAQPSGKPVELTLVRWPYT